MAISLWINSDLMAMAVLYTSCFAPRHPQEPQPVSKTLQDPQDSLPQDLPLPK